MVVAFVVPPVVVEAPKSTILASAGEEGGEKRIAHRLVGIISKTTRDAEPFVRVQVNPARINFPDGFVVAYILADVVQGLSISW